MSQQKADMMKNLCAKGFGPQLNIGGAVMCYLAESKVPGCSRVWSSINKTKNMTFDFICGYYSSRANSSST